MDLGARTQAASDAAVLHIVAQCDVMFEIAELSLRVYFRVFELLTHRAAYPGVNGQLCEASCAISVSRHLLRRYLDFVEPNSRRVSHMA